MSIFTHRHMAVRDERALSQSLSGEDIVKAGKAIVRRRVGRPANSGGRESRSQDGGDTTQLILDAAVRLLAEKGFTGLGVNALANAAGVDKQLIYYHFGGLDGVVRQLGHRLDLWLGTPLVPRTGERYGDAVSRLLLEYAEALRRNPLVRRLLAWELVEPSDALKELEAARSAAMADWVAELRAAAEPAPEGVDAPAINALLLAGLHYLALREESLGTFAGMDIASRTGRARISEAVRLITARTYAGPASPAGGQRRRTGASK
jgi:AcrR family transcriptional regulator